MKKQIDPRWWARIAASSLLVFVHALFGQVPPAGFSGLSLALASGTATLSGTVSLNLSVTATPGNEPAGVQWTL